jgi:excisionase family DNA binding protein
VADVGVPVAGTPPAAGVVADLLESLARRLRQAAEDGEDALAILRHPLADVDGQPPPLKSMPPATTKDALLTANDLAAHLGCSRRTLRRWRHEGRIPRAIRVGRLVRWRRADVDRWERAGGRG